MKNKDSETAPVLVQNPLSGKWININPLFTFYENTQGVGPQGSFPEIADHFQNDVIRFINENCVVQDEKGESAHNMFFYLYQVCDMFNGMAEVSR